ncbi:MAG TPA: acylphosphatase [Methanothrix sp.]|nr:acylphosphatase [Methanothrix sp.]
MKLTLKISGTKVHDVGYRAFLLEAAEDLRMRGFFAQNTVEDGMQAVIVYLEGNESSMEKYQKIAQMQRPDKAVVSSIAFVEGSDEVEDIDVFAARFQARQLRKGISSIIRIEEKKDRMIDLQTQMLGKQDQMLEKQDRTIDKLEDVGQNVVGEIRSSTDAIVSEIRESRERGSVELRDSHAALRSYLDARLGKMDEDISRIKAKIGM